MATIKKKAKMPTSRKMAGSGISPAKTGEAAARQCLRVLLRRPRLAVLATQGDGEPYASLVAVVAAADGTRLWFASRRGTRKFANLLAGCRVALLFDNRRNRADDFVRAVTAMAAGKVSELAGAARIKAVALLMQQHPALREFLADAQTALLEVQVERWRVIRNFEEAVDVATKNT